MDFRRKSSSLHAQFVFYINQTFKKAFKQWLYVRIKAQAFFAENSVDYVMGAHPFQ